MKTSQAVNILVVDDVPEKALAIEATLSDLGQNIVKAGSGREALRCLLKDDFAVILLDVNMPEMDGFETAALIRQRKRSELTPIIFVTAFNDDSHVAKGYSLGAVDFISAPAEPDVLRTKVGVFVDLYQKTETIRQQAAHRVQLAREQSARQAAEKAMRRSALLAEASRLVSRSLDFDETLATLCEAVVPALADACQLVLHDPNGGYWFAPAASSTPAGKDSAKSSHARIATVSAALTQVVKDAIESGHAQPIDAEAVSDAPDLDAKRKWASVIVVPLNARDVPLGAIVCCLQGARRQFDPSDVALIENLVSRAATALENARLYQTIRDGERRKDEFLAMLGHELRNPLAAITNAGELTKLLDPLDPTFDEAIDIIRQQASLMKRLVDDLLDVSRITSGRIELKKSAVCVGDVLERMADLTSTVFKSRGHTLHLSVPKEKIVFDADPCRLEQILTNLLVNASKYTDPGGDVWLSVVQSGPEVIFRVRDSGIGIGPDLLPNVFDLFAQANRSLHRAEGGLGIGLTIVRGLAELHGGRVSATSEGFGRGAEFVVSLPAHKKLAALEPLVQPPEIEAGGEPRRILVVEDQAALSHVTVALLRKLGHEVRAAADGVEALTAVREYRPDVVLLDIGLPGMDGYEVASSLRTEMGDAAPLLVAMTGYGQHEFNRHASNARFDHHLVKPADVGALREVLTHAK
ncbi:MAG TPA: response regulator [Lacipirellulaceae bacterium]|jgi:signal transduction histidine kinase/DNA-binding response OmpR family regulator